MDPITAITLPITARIKEAEITAANRHALRDHLLDQLADARIAHGSRRDDLISALNANNDSLVRTELAIIADRKLLAEVKAAIATVFIVSAAPVAA